MSDDGMQTANVGRWEARFVSGGGAVVLVIGIVLLVTSDDRRSVESHLTSVFLGCGFLLIAPGRSRPWIKRASVAAFIVAIALAIHDIFLVGS